jgi:hypothetical protein
MSFACQAEPIMSSLVLCVPFEERYRQTSRSYTAPFNDTSGGINYCDTTLKVPGESASVSLAYAFGLSLEQDHRLASQGTFSVMSFGMSWRFQ